jgi:hypothetical protein
MWKMQPCQCIEKIMQVLAGWHLAGRGNMRFINNTGGEKLLRHETDWVPGGTQ